MRVKNPHSSIQIHIRWCGRYATVVLFRRATIDAPGFFVKRSSSYNGIDGVGQVAMLQMCSIGIQPMNVASLSSRWGNNGIGWLYDDSGNAFWTNMV